MQKQIHFRTLLILSSIAICQAIALADEAERSLAESQRDRLVEQLGDPSFKTRESAAEQLLDQGLEAKPALLQALEHTDIEVRLRADQLLRSIVKADLEQRLSVFIDDVDGNKSHDLPGWEKYREVAGSDRSARELFAEMTKSERFLLGSIDGDQANATAAYAGRVFALQSSTIPGLSRSVSPASIATILFVGSDPNIKLDTMAGYKVYSLLNQTSVAKSISAGNQSEVMKRLLAAWLERISSNGYLARSGLQLTMRYKMKEVGLRIAKALVAQEETSLSSLPYAMLTIGKFGEKDDFKLVEPLLENKSVCHTWSNGKFKEPVKVQVRDVALAVAIHLTNQSHNDYGFELLQKYEMTLFHVYTCGFVEAAKREAAFAQWNSWSDKQN